MGGYVDDYGAIWPMGILIDARITRRVFCSVLYFALKPSKGDSCNRLPVLRAIGEFPSVAHGAHLAVTIRPEKASRRAKLIANSLTNGEIDHVSSGRLIGKLSFRRTAPSENSTGPC